MRTVRSSRADVIVSIVLVLMLGTFTIAQINNADEIANRVRCASNLRQIGQAILLYSNENRGAYPRTTWDVNNAKPTWGTPYEGDAKLGPVEQAKSDPFDAKKSGALPKPNDVTAALFLLLRTQDITSEVFICPSTGMEKWDYGGGKNTPLNWSNWQGNKGLADHLSYSYQNAYPTKDAIGKGFKLNNAISAEFAIVSDMNPGIDTLIKVPLAAGEDAVRIGNSPNHGGDGQNVLYGDGHVEFQGSPYVGVARDNIYTYGDSGPDHKGAAGDGIVGASVGPNDSVLLPTARDVGVIDAEGKLTDAARKRRLGIAPNMKPATPQLQDAMRQKIMGNYVQEQPGGRRVKLQVTKDQLIGSTGPVTITFNYTIANVGDGAAQLVLTAPDTPESSTMIRVDADGVTMSGGQLHGKWAKQ
jgi:prepilin-type processing-associated H-X9-DG protein